MSDKNIKLPVWDDKYENLGVTPIELYMRQNGLCWLTTEVSHDGSVTLLCTDGTDRSKTKTMLNPTYECARCIASFTEKSIEDITKK